MTCQDTGRWNTLSRGSEALIKECGPEKFKSAFERALLESQRAFFVSLESSHALILAT